MYIIGPLSYNNISWLYTNDRHHLRNKNLRFIGNRNTLSVELEAAKLRTGSWSDIYLHQTFHDFLVVIAMNQYGLLNEYPVERFYRDAKFFEIGEGTSEILRTIAVKSILNDFNT